MTSVILPFNPQPGQLEDITQVNANINQLVGVVNGNLELGVNVLAGSPSTVPGNASNSGTSNAAARADHTHIIQGFEQATADPTTSNFVGRLYYNTASNKLRMCINAAASGTWITAGNIDATELALHASNHASGGTDPLPNNSISNAMSARALAYDQDLAADVAVTAAFTDMISFSFTCNGTQIVHVTGWFYFVNTAAAVRTPQLRLRESGATVGPVHFGALPLDATGGSQDRMSMALSYYHGFATGAHTVTLQACAPGGTGVTMTKNLPIADGETSPGSHLSVMVG